MSKSFCKKVTTSVLATLLKINSDTKFSSKFRKAFRNTFLIARLRTTALNKASKQYFLLKIIQIKIKQSKLKRAKIYIQENQISHEIYHLHFLKRRLRAGERREKQRPDAAQMEMELLATLVNWYKLLTIAGKGSILNSDKDHRFASKYVTMVLFIHSFFDEAKKMAND